MDKVKVVWLVKKPGWITSYNKDIADRLVAKCKVEIVEDIDDGLGLSDIGSLNKEQLMSLAEERGVKVNRVMPKKEIIAAITNDDEDKDKE